MGNANTSSSTFSNIIPALQHRGVISVVLGDYHYGALTATGELLTWGEYSHGALGLGDPVQLPVGVPGGFAEARMRDAAREGRRRREPESVKVPTEVKFGRKGKFVIQAAAAGWHMGALVIDVDVSIIMLLIPHVIDIDLL
jgi:SCF-associated factor 1